MSSDAAPRALFVAKAGSRAAWYRCVLPAMFGGWDWAAVGGDPPGLEFHSGWVDASTAVPDLTSYDVVVMQQPRGNRWRSMIKNLQGLGVTVLYEIDDYVHEISKTVDHDFRDVYRSHNLKAMEVCMRQCDGILFSTEVLARAYGRFARRSWVCGNGLDMGRYRLTKPPRGELGGRETVTIMWAGATGHQLAALPWVRAVADVMRRVPHTSFVTIGQDFAGLLRDEFADRVITVPFTSLESYPAAMMMGDVALAPAGDSKWYECKSDLRVMEAAALGIPVVADDKYAASVETGETGLLLSARPARMVGGVPVASQTTVDMIAARVGRLVRDDAERARMGREARRKAETEFAMEHKVGAWQDALREAATVRGRIGS